LRINFINSIIAIYKIIIDLVKFTSRRGVLMTYDQMLVALMLILVKFFNYEEIKEKQ